MTDFVKGLHKGLSYNQYDLIPALRASVLKDMHRSPAHARYNMIHYQESTKAFLIGEAIHTVILEPDRFDKEYIACPHNNKDYEWSTYHKNATKYKDGYRLWQLENDNKIILTSQEIKMCKSMRDAAWSHPTVRKLLSSSGANELTICWNDPSTGIPCKARIDRLTSYEGRTIIVDLKSTQDASEYKFAYDAFKYLYHYQMAFYRRGLNVLDKSRSRQCWLIALEKKEPYCLAPYKLDTEIIDIAESSVQNLIYKYSECKESGNWPGYSNDVETLILPKYAYQEEGSDDDNESIMDN